MDLGIRESVLLQSCLPALNRPIAFRRQKRDTTSVDVVNPSTWRSEGTNLSASRGLVWPPSGELEARPGWLSVLAQLLERRCPQGRRLRSDLGALELTNLGGGR